MRYLRYLLGRQPSVDQSTGQPATLRTDLGKPQLAVKVSRIVQNSFMLGIVCNTIVRTVALVHQFVLSWNAYSFGLGSVVLQCFEAVMYASRTVVSSKTVNYLSRRCVLRAACTRSAGCGLCTRDSAEVLF